MHPDIALNVISEELLREFIQSSVLLAVEQDLYAPPFQDIQVIPLALKIQDQMAGAEKVGFQMKAKK